MSLRFAFVVQEVGIGVGSEVDHGNAPTGPHAGFGDFEIGASAAGVERHIQSSFLGSLIFLLKDVYEVRQCFECVCLFLSCSESDFVGCVQDLKAEV